MRSKITSCVVISIVFTIAFSMSVFAQNTSVLDTLHNVNASGCAGCHVPHNAISSPSAPLWSQTITTQTFTTYDSTAPTTYQGGTNTIVGATRLCLSCHDGATTIVATSAVMTGENVVGTDLTTDHPVGFTYDSSLAAADAELVDPSADGDTDADTVGGAAPYLELFGSRLECATCHDAHEYVNGNFLRIANGNSDLCLKCHQK